MLAGSFAPGPKCCCGNREPPARPAPGSCGTVPQASSGADLHSASLDFKPGPLPAAPVSGSLQPEPAADSVQRDHSPASWICCGHEVCARARGSLAGTDKLGVACTVEGLIYLSESPEGASPSLLPLARGRGTPLSWGQAVWSCWEQGGAATSPAQGMPDASSSTRRVREDASSAPKDQRLA